MVYHGIVSNGVVVLEGEKPQEGTLVEVAPVLSEDKGELPGGGIWRDRKDLPINSAEASLELRKRVEQRDGET